MAKIKIYLVKREVKAKNIKEALTKPGIIYEICETKDEPVEQKEKIGFTVKKK